MTRMREGQTCVYCRKHPVEPAWRPFCSERCKLIDFGGWLEERNAIPGEPAEIPDDETDDERGAGG